jgi:hypothetical protein
MKKQMKKHFQQAASPYLQENSRESRAIRHFYFLAMLAMSGGMLLSLATGLLNA